MICVVALMVATSSVGVCAGYPPTFWSHAASLIQIITRTRTIKPNELPVRPSRKSIQIWIDCPQAVNIWRLERFLWRLVVVCAEGCVCGRLHGMGSVCSWPLHTVYGWRDEWETTRDDHTDCKHNLQSEEEALMNMLVTLRRRTPPPPTWHLFLLYRLMTDSVWCRMDQAMGGLGRSSHLGLIHMTRSSHFQPIQTER